MDEVGLAGQSQASKSWSRPAFLQLEPPQAQSYPRAVLLRRPECEVIARKVLATECCRLCSLSCQERS